MKRKYPCQYGKGQYDYNRGRWYAIAEIKDGRAIGVLYGPGWNSETNKEILDCIVRQHFDVKVANDRFKVDIGTGSGVSVKFNINITENITK